ncbi:ATP-dependent DNA helicase MER3, partial [Spiromyces aspiralis]
PPFNSVFPFEYFNKVQSECFSKGSAFNDTKSLVVSGKSCIQAGTMSAYQLILTANAHVTPCLAPTGSGKTGIMELAIVSQFTRPDAQSTKVVYLAPIKIDEVHMIKERRGATLEAVVNRFKYINKDIRIIALSATVGNIYDIARWVGKSASNSNLGTSPTLDAKAEVCAFGEEYRPVPLTKFVYCFPSTKQPFLFERSLDYKSVQLLDIIKKHGDGKPALIFCSTRKSAQQACTVILDAIRKEGSGGPYNTPADISNSFNDKRLADLVPHGIGFHHAGLDYEDRRKVEQLFLDNMVTILLGVNLPAHLVIIKGTKGYDGGTFSELTQMSILQMMGRAGRPQFDTDGAVVIMTTEENRTRYEAMISGCEVLESTLHENLIEHINSEIVLGCINCQKDIENWLGSTFLAMRLKQNPRHYKLPGEESGDAALTTDERLEGFAAKVVRDLEATQLIRVLERHRVLVPLAILHDILYQLEQMCKAAEFQDYRIAMGEKGLLNELNKDPAIRFPLQRKVKDISDKIYILTQVAGVEIKDNPAAIGLKRNTSQLLQHGLRVVKCMIEHYVQNMDVVGARNALRLHRYISAECWDMSYKQLCQIDKIGPRYSKILWEQGIRTAKQVTEIDPRSIEHLLGRKTPFGNQVVKSAGNIAQLSVTVTQTRFTVGVELANSGPSYTRQGKPLWGSVLAWIGENKFVIFRRIRLKKVAEEKGAEFDLHIPFDDTKQQLYVQVGCDDQVGGEVAISTPLRVTSKFFSQNVPVITRSSDQNAQVKTSPSLDGQAHIPLRIDEGLSVEDQAVATAATTGDRRQVLTETQAPAPCKHLCCKGTSPRGIKRKSGSN